MVPSLKFFSTFTFFAWNAVSFPMQMEERILGKCQTKLEIGSKATKARGAFLFWPSFLACRCRPLETDEMVHSKLFAPREEPAETDCSAH